MRQYFTYRLLPVANGWVTPDQMLATGYIGLDFKYELEMCTSDFDGRRMGWVDVPYNQFAQDQINSLIEGLAAWGVHTKNIWSAQQFAFEQTGTRPEVVSDTLKFKEIENDWITRLI